MKDTIKKVLKRIIFYFIKKVDNTPRLRVYALATINKFPTLKSRLKCIASSSVVQKQANYAQIIDLSPEAKKIYKRLKAKL